MAVLWLYTMAIFTLLVVLGLKEGQIVGCSDLIL